MQSVGLHHLTRTPATQQGPGQTPEQPPVTDVLRSHPLPLSRQAPVSTPTPLCKAGAACPPLPVLRTTRVPVLVGRQGDPLLRRNPDVTTEALGLELPGHQKAGHICGLAPVRPWEATLPWSTPETLSTPSARTHTPHCVAGVTEAKGLPVPQRLSPLLLPTPEGL